MSVHTNKLVSAGRAWVPGSAQQPLLLCTGAVLAAAVPYGWANCIRDSIQAGGWCTPRILPAAIRTGGGRPGAGTLAG